VSDAVHQDAHDPAAHTAAKPVTLPLLLWLIPQLLALSLAAARVPLSAHFVAPGEALAIHEMLIVQFAASAMLFPFLLRDLRCCIAMILSSAPMLQLAGLLSQTRSARVTEAWICVAIWLAALAIWRRALAPRFYPIAIALANLLTVGGLILWYLSSEFIGHAQSSYFFPLVATLRLISGETSFLLPLLTTTFLAATAVGALSLMRRRACVVK
jgi:hypothetical protein